MSEPVAVMRQDLYNIKKHDIKTHILKHKRLICPYFFFPFNEIEQKSQKDEFKKLKKGDVIIIRQTCYGSVKHKDTYLKVKIIEDEPEFSPIPNLFLIFKKNDDNSYFLNKHKSKELSKFIEDIKILNDKEIADYTKKGYNVQRFEALNFKIEIMEKIEGDDQYSNYLNNPKKGSIELINQR